MTDYRTRESGLIVPTGASNVTASSRELRERIAELETGNDDGDIWLPLGDTGDFEFSRGFVIDIIRLARVMFIKNPIVGRGVKVKADYVFGRRVTISARDEMINAVIKQFLDDERNQDEFSSHASRIQREIELQTDGNIYFALIPHPVTGRVRVRTIPANEITTIIKNPNDRKERWYYKREWIERGVDLATGEEKDTSRKLYYRDWRYKPEFDAQRIGTIDIAENIYIYHIKVGGFSDWTYGIPEIYSALDWAKAYKKFLENWSAIVSAYARFAFKVTTTGGKTGIAAAKDRLASTASTSGGVRIDNNPAPATGSTFIAQAGNSIDPIRTSGATTSAEDGRRLLLMVAASFGLPETFFGDVSVGTLATAESLDRPTELMLTNRQSLWADIYTDIIRFVMQCAVTAPEGALRTVATVVTNEYGEDEVIYDDDIDTTIAVTFPKIIELDTEAAIRAVVLGSTFDGKAPSVINDPKLLARLVLEALGVDDIDKILSTLYPTDLVINPDEDEDGSPDQSSTRPAAERTSETDEGDELAQATEALRDGIKLLRETLRDGFKVTDASIVTAAARGDLGEGANRQFIAETNK